MLLSEKCMHSKTSVGFCPLIGHSILSNRNLTERPKPNNAISNDVFLDIVPDVWRVNNDIIMWQRLFRVQDENMYCDAISK